MKLLSKFFLVACVAGLLSTTSVIAQDSKLPSAEDVLKKYTEVTGGVENYKAIRTLKAKGTISIPAQGITGDMEMKMVLPNQVWSKTNMPTMGMTQVRGMTDGVAWDSNSMMGARLVTGKEAAMMKQETKMGRYTDPKNHFKSMKNTGIVDVAGEKAYKLELEDKDGNKKTEFYSVKSGLLVQTIMKMTSPMGEMQVKVNSSNYKKTGKFTNAHKQVQDLGTAKIIIEYESFEYNAKVDKSELTPPDDIKKLLAKEKKD